MTYLRHPYRFQIKRVFMNLSRVSKFWPSYLSLLSQITMSAQLVIRVIPIWFVQIHLDPTPAAVTKDIAQKNYIVQVMIRWRARYKNSQQLCIRTTWACGQILPKGIVANINLLYTTAFMRSTLFDVRNNNWKCSENWSEHCEWKINPINVVNWCFFGQFDVYVFLESVEAIYAAWTFFSPHLKPQTIYFIIYFGLAFDYVDFGLSDFHGNRESSAFMLKIFQCFSSVKCNFFIVYAPTEQKGKMTRKKKLEKTLLHRWDWQKPHN